MKNKNKFITNEDYSGKLHPVDEELLDAVDKGGTDGMIKIESMEQLQQLAKDAANTYKKFELQISKVMTKQRAEQVRVFRVEQNYSWRLLAAACWALWNEDAKWNPPSNQLAGMALCEVAGRILKKPIK